jgi:hypothetical protein
MLISLFISSVGRGPKDQGHQLAFQVKVRGPQTTPRIRLAGRAWHRACNESSA